nr:ABC transporter ATP-binding protein [uncultured Albidiferax sp.]
MKALSIRNVAKDFGGLQVLKGINIDVEPGQFLILVGPSGCGKSTLMNCLAGLDTPSAGDILLDGKNLLGVPPKDRNIAMVFQSYALYPNMNVRENIEFGLRMRKMPDGERQGTMERVSKMLQIENLLERKPGQLSGGQRQRVAMGRALARDPGLFLFDEPLSNLDAKLRVEMRAEIKLLHQRTKTTSVYVTHDQVEAMTLGDCIAVMKDGIVQQFGTPFEIYTRPANQFVASFIGSPSMNFIPVTLFSGAAMPHVRLEAAGNSLVLQTQSSSLAAYADRDIVLGLRPEAIEFGNSSGLLVQVRLVEPTGPDTYVFFEVNGVSCVGRVAPSKAPQPGEWVHASFDLRDASYFDPENGRSVGIPSSVPASEPTKH